MKILILIAVTLHLVIEAAEGELHYGDIITVSRTCGCFGFTYKHYGIYLDKKRFEDQKDDDNIFHFTGLLSKPPFSCIFGKVTIQDYEKDNYLDKIEIYKNKVSTDEITKRIKEKYKSCGKLLKTDVWSLSNNCEHLANYIRYGEKISLQIGQKAAALVRNPEKTKKEIKDIKQQLKISNEVPCDETCTEQGTEILKNDYCDETCASTNTG